MEMHEGWGERPARRGPSVGVVIFLALFFGLIGGLGGMMLAVWANQQYNLKLPGTTRVELPQVTRVQPAGDVTLGGSFADIEDQLNDSVVHIKSTTEQIDPFSLFFNNSPQPQTGIGTGVIVSADGYILTNYHVVGEAKQITVKVLSGKTESREYPAKVLGGDKREDLALIKIDAHGLRPVAFGDSDKLRPGDAVMAIGNPFGFEHTVSVGVVSALNRDLPVDETVMLKHMIQTDASINPGNSGGPLVNTLGQVVGINSAIFVGGGGGPQANGIGFAIPSNHATKIMKMLREKKRIEHPYIGISYRQIDDDIRRSERLPVKSGVIVQDVMPGSPAARGGLAENDIILSVDGREITEQDTLMDYIGTKAVGATISMAAKRWDIDTSEWVDQTVRVKIGDKPDDFETRMQPQQEDQSSPHGMVPDERQSSPDNEGFPFPFFGR